jgi:chromosome segregation and condensation protein ScpB
VTASEFLATFDLQSLRDLPDMAQLENDRNGSDDGVASIV